MVLTKSIPFFIFIIKLLEKTMFINKDIDSELQQLIQNKDWSDYCSDPKYKTDSNFKTQYHIELYNKFVTDSEDLIDKILTPFYRNDYVVNRTTNKMSSSWAFDWNSPTFLFNLEYDVKFSNDSQTNPFICNIQIKATKENGSIKYQWWLKNPERIYIRKYLNSGNHVNCNKLLFTNRGFMTDGWQTYRFYKSINEWTDVGCRGDEICKHLKKTISTMKSDYEQIQKDISVKKAQRSIQLDEILNMMEEINAKIKDTNLKFLIDDNGHFDYIDSPIKFDLSLSNNPKQNDENLKILSDEDIILGDSWRSREKLTDEDYARNKIKLYTWHYTSGSYSYRNRMTISITYNPTNSNWIMKFTGYNADNELFMRLFKCDNCATFTSVDKMGNYILNILLKDHKLYNKMEEWLNESN